MARINQRASKSLATRKHSKKGKNVKPSVSQSPAPAHRCDICYNEQPLDSFPSVGSTVTHEHESNTCRKCFNRYIVGQIESGESRLTCAECQDHLSYEDIKTIVSKTSLAKYDKLLLKTAVEADADFRYCMSAKCKSGQTHIGGADEPIFTCNACNSKHCVVCEIPWHENESCDHHIARYEENVKTEAVISDISKPCPGACGAMIERNGGCPHMVCTRCDFDFCWLCLNDFAHERGPCTPHENAVGPSLPESMQAHQEQRQARLDAHKEADEKSESFISTITKQCPECNVPIEKDGGCDRMTCSSCHHQFCWLCLADYSAIIKHDNRRHKVHCAYHPAHADSRVEPTKTESSENESSPITTKSRAPKKTETAKKVGKVGKVSKKVSGKKRKVASLDQTPDASPPRATKRKSAVKKPSTSTTNRSGQTRAQISTTTPAVVEGSPVARPRTRAQTRAQTAQQAIDAH